MYSYFKGNITEIYPNYVTLEVNNVGYLIYVPNPYVFKVDEFVTIYVSQIVKEDSNNLYGFKEKEARNLFLKLISVNGIGPKSAMSILATGNVNDVLNAIEQKDSVYLTKFPGIGPKAASQIILDLKGKLVIEQQLINTDYDDVRDALVALGYKNKDVEKVLPKLSGSTSDMIKQALQLMLR